MDNSLSLFKKQYPLELPLDAFGNVLFRITGTCTNNCPMCTNRNPDSRVALELEELKKRLEFIISMGGRRVVVTGGEPLSHPEFVNIANYLNSRDVVWDLNTNGQFFESNELVVSCKNLGMRRVIVSFHSHLAEETAVITGNDNVYHDCVSGIKNLIANNVSCILNMVLTKFNAFTIQEYLEFCETMFGGQAAVKITFPVRTSDNKNWDGINFTYDDLKTVFGEFKSYFGNYNFPVYFENIPYCILGFSPGLHMGRSGFGETHYLDDDTGSALYSMKFLEADNSVYSDACRQCTVFKDCPGIIKNYIRDFSIPECIPYV